MIWEEFRRNGMFQITLNLECVDQWKPAQVHQKNQVLSAGAMIVEFQ